MQLVFILEWFLWNFSSPKLKADTNCSDHLLFFCLSVYCPSVFLWTFYIFIFFSTTTRSISTKLGKTHSWMKGNQVFKNKSPCTFSTIDDSEIVNYFTNLQNLFLIHKTNFNRTWHKVSLREETSSLFKWRTPTFFKGK